jgi:eukaryotic-like serine/threonine-protein kinase
LPDLRPSDAAEPAADAPAETPAAATVAQPLIPAMESESPLPLLSDRPAAYRPTGAPSRPREIDRRVVFIAAGAVVVVLVVVGIALLLNSGGTPSHQAGGPTGATTTETLPPETRPSASTVNTPTVGQAPSTGQIGYSAAGQTVVNYFGDLGDPVDRFYLLTPGAQAAFGGLAEFTNYWKQYSQLSSAHAIGVTTNGDGSVEVPIDVTYTTGSGSSVSTQTKHETLRVVQENGKLLIDEVAK